MDSTLPPHFFSALKIQTTHNNQSLEDLYTSKYVAIRVQGERGVVEEGLASVVALLYCMPELFLCPETSRIHYALLHTRYHTASIQLAVFNHGYHVVLGWARPKRNIGTLGTFGTFGTCRSATVDVLRNEI